MPRRSPSLLLHDPSLSYGVVNQRGGPADLLMNEGAWQMEQRVIRAGNGDLLVRTARNRQTKGPGYVILR